jgi:hypothetical protein
VRSKQAADPRGKSRNRREYDEKFQQLAFHVKSVLSSVHYVCSFRVKILKEMGFQKQKAVNEDHVAKLVDRKYGHKSCEEL